MHESDTQRDVRSEAYKDNLRHVLEGFESELARLQQRVRQARADIDKCGTVVGVDERPQAAGDFVAGLMTDMFNSINNFGVPLLVRRAAEFDREVLGMTRS